MSIVALLLALHSLLVMQIEVTSGSLPKELLLAEPLPRTTPASDDGTQSECPNEQVASTASINTSLEKPNIFGISMGEPISSRELGNLLELLYGQNEYEYGWRLIQGVIEGKSINFDGSQLVTFNNLNSPPGGSRIFCVPVGSNWDDSNNLTNGGIHVLVAGQLSFNGRHLVIEPCMLLSVSKPPITD